MDGSQIPKITLKYSLKVEEMWDIQERGGDCEVRTGQRPDPWKEDDDEKICLMNGCGLTVFHTELEGHVKKFHELHTVTIC